MTVVPPKGPWYNLLQARFPCRPTNAFPESTRMARIRIDDLPPDTDLTPEELEQIYGAGRPSFRPSLESLEKREMYAANLGTVLTPSLLRGAIPAHGDALMRTFTPMNQIQVQGVQAQTLKQGLGQHMPAGVNPLAPNQTAAKDQLRMLINRYFS